MALGSLLGLGAVLRAWLCFHDDGIYWPDEIFQSLEPAHRLIFGYGLIPWEFRDGARPWTFPAMVTVLLKLSTLVVGDSPRHYLIAMRLLFSAISMATAWGIYRLARACGARPTGAALGAAFFALAPPVIYFAPRALSESGSALPLVFGLALAIRPKASWRAVAVGASLVGIATLMRIQNGVFGVGLLATLLGRRQWRQFGLAVGVLLVWGFLDGLIDRITWGGWYHAAIAYLKFTLVEDKSSQWGVMAPTYYPRVLWTSMPLITAFALPLSLAAIPRATGLFATLVLNLLLLSRVNHKEYRFLLTSLPLWFALAGVGHSAIASFLAKRWNAFRRGGEPLTAAIAAACAAVAGVRFHELTFGDIGQYEDQRPQASAYDDAGALNRLLLVAHRQSDLCGIMIEASHLAWTGGATYLHRNVPIYSRGDWMHARNFNYILTFGGLHSGRVVASEGPLALVNVGRSCAPDPGYNWWLP